MTRERTISATIVRWLNAQPRTWACTITAGTFTRRGLPDILATVDGWSLAIEVKQPRAHLTPLQADTLNTIEDAGALAIVARSLEDVQRVHNQIRISPKADRRA